MIKFQFLHFLRNRNTFCPHFKYVHFFCENKIVMLDEIKNIVENMLCLAF